MSVSISSPSSNSSVGWSFLVLGSYDLGSGLLNPTTSAGTIVVTVYESDGSTPLANTTVVPSSIDLPPGVQIGAWKASVTHQANYTGAIIKAVLTPTGGTPTTASVSNITITQSPSAPVPTR